MIKSIVICKNGKLGYVASLRFEDDKLDQDISSSSKPGIYRAIDYIVKKANKK